MNALKANGEVVTVTGDGVNDAAALKAAHIGVAMGITGTDVAKEASDMVVLDDNFASIYKAVIEGRVAFDNIRKATSFLLTFGVGMLVAIFVTISANIPLILLPAQILWLNLVTAGLQDISLAFEPKEPGVERRQARDPKEGVLSRVLIFRVAVLGSIIATISLGTFMHQLSTEASLAHTRTIVLTTIVFAQFFNVFNARSEKTSIFRQDPTENRFLLISVLAAAAAQLALLYLPAMRSIFRNTVLSFGELLTSMALASTVLIASEIHKWWLRLVETRRSEI